MLAVRDVDHQGEETPDNAPVVLVRDVNGFERTPLPPRQRLLGGESDRFAGEDALDVRAHHLIQLVPEDLANRRGPADSPDRRRTAPRTRGC